MTFSRPLIAIAFVVLCALTARAVPRATTVAVLNFGDSDAGRRAADEMWGALKVEEEGAGFRLTSRGAARAAAKGAGYAGSLNLSLEEARDLSAALGCDFFFTGAADTVPRQPAGRPVHYESYASVFLVSAFTGRLVLWEHLSAESPTAAEAEKSLAAQLRARAADYVKAFSAARANERAEHRIAIERDTPVIEEVPAEDAPEAKSFRVPLPYRRLRPEYTEAASRVNAEASVDALVELDEEGEVRSVEIVRWAGYGLDESVARTVRQMHFRAALRDGKPVPVRALLRYNFRRPK
ncbi:MAG TPA: energy transducer TonB [Pyrinomonadaceae bacterium]|nr:energy transducer TonB [Pyrinomonadaceae bacterium]